MEDFDMLTNEEVKDFFRERAAIMVNRGNCPFARKSINIQKIGARLALIADNIEEDEDTIIMVDLHNQGDQVHIPTYMLSHSEAAYLQTAIHDRNQSVIVKYSLEVTTMQNASNTIPYMLWYSGVQDFYEFDFREVEDVYLQLSQSEESQFAPMAFTWRCPIGECLQEIVETNCISQGEYCMTFPGVAGITLDFNHTEKIRVKDAFFEELLRSRCVARALPGKFLSKWFTYMEVVQEQCYLPSLASFKKFTRECSQKVLESLEISIPDIEACISNSFEVPGNFSSQNTILKQDRTFSTALGVRGSPQLSIGDSFLYRGEFRAYDIKRAVCSAFRRQPQVCHSSTSNAQNDEEARARLVAMSEVLAVAIGVILLNVVVVLVYRWLQRERRQRVMKEVVNQEVSKYFKIATSEYSTNIE